VQLGYRDIDWMLQDPDLEVLKEHKGFQALITEINPQN